VSAIDESGGAAVYCLYQNGSEQDLDLEHQNQQVTVKAKMNIATYNTTSLIINK
jgi:hypothetical protein